MSSSVVSKKQLLSALVVFVSELSRIHDCCQGQWVKGRV